MSWGSATLLFLVALLGAPLFAVFGAGSMLGFYGLSAAEDVTIVAAASDTFGEKFATSVMLVTIPLFTFAGYLMAESKAPTRLVNVSKAWLGWLPGGVPMVALGACAFFTAFTGGSGITIVAIGGLLYPALRSVKYTEKFSLGMVTTGGSLGLLFPPSVPVILYAVVASGITAELIGEGILVEKLFVAGAIPGLITVLALWGYAIFAGHKSKMERTPFDFRVAWKTTLGAIWEIVLPFFLVVGLVNGWLRIHEAAAFTAAYILVVEVFIYRDIPIRDLTRVIREAMTLVGAIMAILVTAIGFTWYLVYAQVPQHILDWVQGIVSDKWTFLLMLNLFLILVGMMMDIFSAIVVIVPLIIPLAVHYGVDPYHLGIVFLLNLEIGYLTPPVGLNLFISSFRFGKPVTLLYRAVLPFIGVLIVALALTTYIEDLSLWLTRMVTMPGETPTAQPTGPPDEIDLGDDFTLDDLEDEGGSALDALEDDLEGGGSALDALEDELGGDEGNGALDALEEELDDGESSEPSDEGSGGALDALERELDQ